MRARQRLWGRAHTRTARVVGLAAALGAIAASAPPASQAAAAPYLSPGLDAFTPVDTQFTEFTATVSCPSEAGFPISSCPVTLKLSWRPADRRTYKAKGGAVALSARTVTLSPGQSQTLTLAAPKRLLRDVTASRHVAAIVYATLLDNRTGTKVGQLQYMGPSGAFTICPGPAYVHFTGGPVVVINRTLSGKTTLMPVVSGDLEEGEDLQAGDHAVQFTMLGVTYRISPHALFARTCWSLTDYAGGRPAPTVVIDSGSIHVSGRPRGIQYWVGVGTPEGNLGSRSRERVAFTVTRNARAEVSTMRVSVGRTTQVTPFDTPTRSPCTNGQALSVDRYGHIHRLP